MLNGWFQCSDGKWHRFTREPDQEGARQSDCGAEYIDDVLFKLAEAFEPEDLPMDTCSPCAADYLIDR